MSELNLNTQEYPASEGFPEAKPAGTALVIMTKSEMKATKANNGTALHMYFKILDGEYKDQLLYIVENWQNANDETVRIGRGRISSIANAVGLQNVQHSEQMHNKPFTLQWGYQPAQGAYGAKNNIVVARASGVTTQAQSFTMPPAATTPPEHKATTETSQPWNPTGEAQFNNAELSGATARPGMPPSNPAAKPVVEKAAILPNGHPTLSEPVENQVTKEWEATDSATGGVYAYKHDGMYHLVPEVAGKPAWG